MNARPLTDAQISRALRAHLPEHAQPGLRTRVIEEAEATTQLRALPSFLGPVSQADPVARRQSLLVAAALLLALLLASAAAVGAAWRLVQRDPRPELSVDPPADISAFVLSSYERLPQLPPVALTWQKGDATKGRIIVDESGAVRFDQFASPDATKPSSYRILRPDHRISGMVTVDSEAVWVEPGHEAIDVPREYIRGVLDFGDWPGCELERDPSAGVRGSPAPGWRYVGVEDVAGRPAHHVACVGDLWIDDETRLILRSRQPLNDDAGQPIPGQFETTEVTEIAFGEQPAALFEPPEGLARISEDTYSAYICDQDLPNELMPGISDCPASEEADAPVESPTAVETPVPVETPVAVGTPVAADDAIAEGAVLRFESGPDGGPGELLAVDPATGESGVLLTNLADLYRAEWSADHRWVVLATAAGLWVMRPGEEPRLVSVQVPGWSWSPNAARLAIPDYERQSLSVVDVPAASTIDLGEMLGGDVTSAPMWSPDGTRLVYGARGGTISVVDVDGGKRSVLVKLPDDDLDSVDGIAWSPDGEVVAIFNDTEPGQGRLYLVNADGSDVRVLLDDADLGGLAWSPDGARLAYFTRRDAATMIVTQARDGDAPTALAEVPDAECAGSVGCGRSLVWSPDGSRIAWPGHDGNDEATYLAVDADGNVTPIDAMTYATWNGGSYP
jgi:hypothetical protein